MTGTRPTLRRLAGSLFYEFLVVFSLLMVGFWIPQTILAPFLTGLDKPSYQRIMILHIFVLLMVYFVWFWINGGQTLSMKTWRLRLISADGYRLRPAQALLRYLAAWPSVVFLIGLLWVFFDRDRRFLHDRIAGTRIVSIETASSN